MVVVVKGCKLKWRKRDYFAETHIKRQRKREIEKGREKKVAWPISKLLPE
jgi:hypothetical protein